MFGVQNPQGYLFGNILLHILCAFQVYLLSLKIFPRNIYVALLSSIFFAVHPLHVESIAWISSRKDPLYTVFFLGSILTLFNYTSTQKQSNLVISFLLFALSLFSKSAAISFFPIALLLLYFFSPHRLNRVSEVVFIVATALLTLYFVHWYSANLQEFGIVKKSFLKDRSFLFWAVNAFTYITFYVEKLFYPSPLSITYDFPAPPTVFRHTSYLISSVLIVGVILSTSIIAAIRKNSAFSFLFFSFVFSLVPFLDLAQVNIFIADRYAYLPSVFFFIFISLAISKLRIYLNEYFNIPKIFISAVLVVIISCFSLKTISQCEVWKDTLALWKNAYIVSPNRIDPYVGQMVIYMNYYLDFKEQANSSISLDIAEALGTEAIKKFCNDSESKCPEQLDKVILSLAEISWFRNNFELAEKRYRSALNFTSNVSAVTFSYIGFLISQKKFLEAKHQVEKLNSLNLPYKDKVALESITTKLNQLL